VNDIDCTCPNPTEELRGSCPVHGAEVTVDWERRRDAERGDITVADVLNAELNADEADAKPCASRDERQARVQEWTASTFGASVASDPTERARRFIEEAIELAQACGLTFAEVHRIVARVYERPKGLIVQEIGGVGVTLLALCEVQQVSADYCERMELARVLAISPDHFRRKQAEKAAAGTAMLPEEARAVQTPPEPPRNTCNKHHDCAAAKAKAVEAGRNPYVICCHSDDCEDCFGS